LRLLDALINFVSGLQLVTRNLRETSTQRQTKHKYLKVLCKYLCKSVVVQGVLFKRKHKNKITCNDWARQCAYKL